MLNLLSVGIIPSVLLVSALILILKIIDMQRTINSRVAKSALKQMKKDVALMKKYRQDREADKFLGEAPVNHLRDKIARYKSANDEIKNRYKE